MNKRQIILWLLLLSGLLVKGQHWQAEPALLPPNNSNKTSIYPAICNINESSNPDKSRSIWHRKIFDEHLVHIDSSDVELIVDPVLDWQLGFENSFGGNKNLYQNTRGYHAYGRLGKCFYFSTEYYENQAVPAGYIKDYVNTFQSYPRLIRAKIFKSNGIDYAPVFGKIAWKPNEKFSITLGYDKIHIGQGYRSMILSSDAKPYPFMMNYYHHNKWAVGNINAIFYNSDILTSNDTLMQIPTGITGEYQRKWASVNWLEFFPVKFIEFGLADIIVCRPEDNSGNHLYLPQLPLPGGLRPLFFSTSNQLTIAATWINLYPSPNLSFYLQGLGNFSIKENDKVKPYYAWQAGAHFFVQKDKWALAIRAEINRAGQYTYSAEKVNGSFTNLGQSAAHPLGQNFNEMLVQAVIRYKKWEASLSAHHLSYRDFDSYGNNIGYYGYIFSAFSDLHKSTGNIILIAPEYKDKNINIAIGELSYTINKVSNFQIFGRILYRQAPDDALNEGRTIAISAGIRHSLRRNNQDFY